VQMGPARGPFAALAAPQEGGRCVDRYDAITRLRPAALAA